MISAHISVGRLPITVCKLQMWQILAEEAFLYQNLSVLLKIMMENVFFYGFKLKLQYVPFCQLSEEFRVITQYHECRYITMSASLVVCYSQSFAKHAESNMLVYKNIQYTVQSQIWVWSLKFENVLSGLNVNK